MAVRPRFDPKRPLVAARDFTFMGKSYSPGDAFGPFDPGVVSDRLRARQYEARAVNFGEGEAAADADPVQMTESETKHTYLITAPWLDEPVRVRGVKNAEKRLAEIREAGAPLGFIEGGSEVTVEGGEGGWYEVNAPWLDEPEKVQGREAAESRQRELHDAGAPEPAEGEETDDETGGGGEEGEASSETAPAGDDDQAGEQQGQPDVDAEGNDAPEDTTMDGKNKTEDQRDVDTSPNEPGTNEPNGAEVINDQVNAGTADEGADGEAGEGGDGTTGSVGP